MPSSIGTPVPGYESLFKGITGANLPASVQAQATAAAGMSSLLPWAAGLSTAGQVGTGLLGALNYADSKRQQRLANRLAKAQDAREAQRLRDEEQQYADASTARYAATGAALVNQQDSKIDLEKRLRALRGIGK